VRGARRLRTAAALLAACLAGAGGCRDNGTGPLQQTGPLVAPLAFTAGDTLTFDAWPLDSYGYPIESAHMTPFWRVLSTGALYAGAAGVTTVVEFSSPNVPSTLQDTLRFRFLPSGDIEQFGYIARVVQAVTGAVLAAGWDRIAAFSLPTNGVWTVGVADSAGGDTLRGTVLGDQGYFVAGYNGVRTAFRGYGVELTSQTLDCTIVFSGAPPAVLFIREESPLGTGGRLMVMSALAHR